MDEIHIAKTKYNLGVFLCWIVVITGLIGLIARIFFMSEDFLWLSVMGVIAGGIGITFGPSLKSTITKVVKMNPIDPKDLQG
jgi:hypothetical protein